MLGLEYVLFVKGVSGKALADKLEIMPMAVGHWIAERRNIPERYHAELESILGIGFSYLEKQVSATDRIEIEILLGGEYDEARVVELVKERDNLQENYDKLLLLRKKDRAKLEDIMNDIAEYVGK